MLKLESCGLIKFFILYLRGLLGISYGIERTCEQANSVYKDFLD